MKHEQSAPAGYRPHFAGTMKIYLVRHKEYGELTVNGVNKYEAVHAAARAWGVRWTAIARECEYIVLAEDTVYFSTAPYNESVDMIIGNHYFCKIF